MRKFILAAAALGFAGLAYANVDTDAADEASQDAELTVEATQDAEAAAETRAGRANCLKYTGSRIRKPGECIEAAGTVHERERLDRTGERTTAEALRRLDPSVRIRR